jgi:hypothetical protein
MAFQLLHYRNNIELRCINYCVVILFEVLMQTSIRPNQISFQKGKVEMHKGKLNSFH